jgi:hypothetical protein
MSIVARGLLFVVALICGVFVSVVVAVLFDGRLPTVVGGVIAVIVMSSIVGTANILRYRRHSEDASR